MHTSSTIIKQSSNNSILTPRNAPKMHHQNNSTLTNTGVVPNKKSTINVFPDFFGQLTDFSRRAVKFPDIYYAGFPEKWTSEEDMVGLCRKRDVAFWPIHPTKTVYRKLSLIKITHICKHTHCHTHKVLFN